jgi:DmsE family decaheme c-type cytochrome
MTRNDRQNCNSKESAAAAGKGFAWGRTALLMLLAVCLGACAGLKQSRPILPLSEYERMIVGRIDADYVGTDNCIAKCHKHDRLTDDFKNSVHGEQIKPETGLPLVNCESCHGPGSLAIAAIDENIALKGEVANRCETDKLLNLQALPSMAQSLICLKCHTTASTPILTFWNSSSHALNDVSCFDCHKLHQGPRQKLSRQDMADLCYGCHPEAKHEFSFLSRHPVMEKKLTCVDCHDVHGSRQDHLLKGNTPKDTCSRCHMDKQGPFVFEHGDVTEQCTNCHTPHGSPFPSLLQSAMPFLCLQCHGGHTALSSPDGVKELYLNRCTDCHSQIHGSDIPSMGTKPGTLSQ